MSIESNFRDFEKCVIIKHGGGRVSISCKLGLWGVDAPDQLRAIYEAMMYWSQYKDDGEYHAIIGGPSPMERMSSGSL